MPLKSSDRGPDFHARLVYSVKVFRLNSRFHVFDHLLYRSPCFDWIFILLCPQRRGADTQAECCDECQEVVRPQFQKMRGHQCSLDRNNRAEFRMKASSEPTWISAAMMGARRPKKAKPIPRASTAIVPQKLNMMTR